MNNLILFLIGVFFWAVGLSCSQKSEVQYILKDEKISDIDKRLFSHFLEKPSWHGEIGPEAALKPDTRELQEGVTMLMHEMNIPVLRFPGGGDVDYADWTDMIDNAIGREGPRPHYVGIKGDTVSLNFGYDEVGQLAHELGAELLLVVNFGDAYLKKRPIQESAMHEAALLAYCVGKQEDQLPGNLDKWVDVRMKNGFPEPFPVKYVQIANEPWFYNDGDLSKEPGAIKTEDKEHYFECLDAYITAFNLVAQDVKIIVDGHCHDLTVPLKERFGDRIDYVAYHHYKPWAIHDVRQADDTLSRAQLSMEDVWKAWVAVPELEQTGVSDFEIPGLKMVIQTGYPVAITEWNWNGWWGGNSVDKDNLGSHYIKGIGAAGFIHAMMRNAKHVKMGFQSMLIGNSWGITGIRVSPEAEHPPRPFPTGQITGFYSNHHGNELLDMEAINIPYYDQPYNMGTISATKGVALIDAIATRNEDVVFFHVINRSFNDDIPVKIDLSSLNLDSGNIRHFVFSGSIDNEDYCCKTTQKLACISQKAKREFKNFEIEMDIPRRSVSIIEISASLEN